MTDISAEDRDDFSPNEEDAKRLFIEHTSAGAGHVVLVTVAIPCGNCGDMDCDGFETAVSVFSDYDKAMEWVYSFDDCEFDFDPFVINDPGFGLDREGMN